MRSPQLHILGFCDSEFFLLNYSAFVSSASFCYTHTLALGLRFFSSITFQCSEWVLFILSWALDTFSQDSWIKGSLKKKQKQNRYPQLLIVNISSLPGLWIIVAPPQSPIFFHCISTARPKAPGKTELRSEIWTTPSDSHSSFLQHQSQCH